MKPIVTWVLIANAREARVVANHGPDKGFQTVEGACWTANPPIEHADAPTFSHSSVGPGQRRVERSSPEAKAEADFAALLCDAMQTHLRRGEFDRLILAAAPHMLGELRGHLSKELEGLIIAEVPKDLHNAALDRLPGMLKDHIAA